MFLTSHYSQPCLTYIHYHTLSFFSVLRPPVGSEIKFSGCPLSKTHRMSKHEKRSNAHPTVTLPRAPVDLEKFSPHPCPLRRLRTCIFSSSCVLVHSGAFPILYYIISIVLCARGASTCPTSNQQAIKLTASHTMEGLVWDHRGEATRLQIEAIGCGGI